MKIDLNKHASESAKIYAEAIIEACQQAKVKDPKLALTDADEFPKLLKIPEVEYAIGWINGCAEALGVLVEVLWDQITEDGDATASSAASKIAARRAGARS